MRPALLADIGCGAFGHSRECISRLPAVSGQQFVVVREPSKSNWGAGFPGMTFERIREQPMRIAKGDG